MATISSRQRKNGKLYKVQIRRGGHYVYRTFPTKPAARAFADNVESNLDVLGAVADQLGIEVENLVETYLDEIGPKGDWETRALYDRERIRTGELTAEAALNSSRTLHDLIQAFLSHRETNQSSDKARHLSWWDDQIGQMPLARVTPKVIRECRNRLLSGTRKQGGHKTTDTDLPMTGATVNRYVASLSSVYTFGGAVATPRDAKYQRLDWVTDNPCRKTPKATEKEFEAFVIKEEEIAALLDACDAHGWLWLRVLIVLALCTGARRGELLGLTWDRVDLERSEVRLNKTKNGKQRTVPLAPPARKALSGWYEQQADESGALMGYVFVDPKDPHRPRTDIDRCWTAVRRDAHLCRRETVDGAVGERWCRFHDLRHSCATYLIAQGVPSLVVSKILGHSSVQMTARYTHADTATMKAELDRVFGALG